MSLVADYGTDSEDSGAEAGPSGPPAVSAAELAARAATADDDDDESEEEEAEEEEEETDGDGDEATGAATALAPPVPLALMEAAADSSDDDEEHPQEQEEEVPTMALPPPDFGDWSGVPGEGLGGPSVPRVSSLGKQKRSSASAHFSSGFRAGVTRHDQLQAKAAADEAEMAESRSRNNGLSSAYDSVFRAPDSELTEEELDRRRRQKTNRKGGVRMISKKEAAKEDALLASLQ
jgi:hypothetical protein